MVIILISALLIGGVAHTSAGNDTNSSRTDATAFSQLHESRTTADFSASSDIVTINSPKSYLARTSSINLTAQTLDYRLPSAETIAVRNITYNNAELRGEVNMYSYTKGTAFFVYGYNQKMVNNLITQYKTFALIPKLETDAVRIYKLDANANGLKIYNRRVSGLVQNTKYYYKLCIEYKNLAGGAVIKCGQLETFTTNFKDPRTNKFSPARVGINSATLINAYDATISGTVTMNDAIDGVAFFVYGTDQDYIQGVDKYFKKYAKVKQDREALQKIRVSLGMRGKGKFTELITDLERDTKYFYRLCVEYDGNQTGLTCSTTRNFTTDARDLSDIPSAVTGASLVGGTTAKLLGSAYMRDYHDGLAFFVYGTDEAKISALGGLGSFNRISQTIDKLQRVSVDNDFDGNSTFNLLVKDLKIKSRYFYRLCVEYQAEDKNNREQLFLACGATKSFQTGF